MRKLRIAQVSNLWGPIPPTNYGGIELMLKMLVDDLVEEGHEVSLFATNDCDTKGDLVSVLPENFMSLILKHQVNLHEYYSNSVVAEALKREKDFDIIHFHALPASIPTMSLANAAVLHTYHNPLHVDDYFVISRNPTVNVSGISKAQMALVAEREEKNFAVIYNGLDFEAYEPRFEKGSYLAFIGRMSRGKNAKGAIEIARQLDLPIMLAGEPINGDDQHYFKEEVLPLVDGEKVKWVGPLGHADKVEFLRNASVLLFPIQAEEAFGYVMIEAMACGTPVVANRLSSVPEVIELGLTGYYTSEWEEMALLVKQAVSLNRLKVRTSSRERFSRRTMLNSYLSLYYEILGKERSTTSLSSKQKTQSLIL
jgi:glycosyltransferase involved in cell wall biosynthesis